MEKTESLTRIHVPLIRPEDVIPHLGSPTHWQPGRSAQSVAESWFHANAIPPSVADVLRQDPIFKSAKLIDAFLERCVDLLDGGRPTQTDLMAIVEIDGGIGVLAIEAKVDEPFGPTVEDWLERDGGPSDQKRARLAMLCGLLKLDIGITNPLRYQLLHRTASAILEARRYRAAHAAMLVQSFCPNKRWFDDFKNFVSALKLGEVEPGKISAMKLCDGISLRVGWVAETVEGPFERSNKARTVPALTELGRVQLSKTFFMRDMLYSEVAAIHGLNNTPDNPELAIAAGTRLCTELLEPLQDRWGRVAVRSAYRSPEVNAFCNAMQVKKKAGYTCASNEANYAGHIWDRRDANGHMGATACVIVPGFWEENQMTGDWQKLARWIDEHLPYSALCFFPTFFAFNITWNEQPKRRISSYADPKGAFAP